MKVFQVRNPNASLIPWVRLVAVPALVRLVREQPSVIVTLVVGVPLVILIWSFINLWRAPGFWAYGLLLAGFAVGLVQALQAPRPRPRLLSFLHQAGEADYRRSGPLTLIIVLGRLPVLLLVWLLVCPQSAVWFDSWLTRLAYIIVCLAGYLVVALWGLSRHAPPILQTGDQDKDRTVAFNRGGIRSLRTLVYLRATILPGGGLVMVILALVVLVYGSAQILVPGIAKPDGEYRAGLFNLFSLMVFGLFHMVLENASGHLNADWYAQAGQKFPGITREIIVPHLLGLIPVALLLLVEAPVFLLAQPDLTRGNHLVWWNLLQAWLVVVADWLLLAWVIWNLGSYPLANSQFLVWMVLSLLGILGLVCAFVAPWFWGLSLGLLALVLSWRTKGM